MRKVLLLCGLLLITFIMQAQVNENDAAIARQLVTSNSTAIGLTTDDLSNFIVSATYQTKEGIRMVYLQQSYKDLPVYNVMQVLAFKNGKLVSSTGGRLSAISERANSFSATPSVDAGIAVRTAFAESGISTNEPVIVRDIVNKKLDFGYFAVTYEKVTAELMWVPVMEGKEVKLAWQIQVAPEKSDDMWMIRVDANTNTVIEKNNLTVYDSWHKEEAEKKLNFVEKRVDFPKNFKYKGYAPPIINGASYLVIKYPAESPQHPGGTAALHTDPWTWAPGNATSLKWHNDGTTDYNITRGNNVWATEDRAAANQNTGLPATSSTPDPLTFNFPPDYTVAPTTATFQQFAITNLFYWNNLLHDLLYQYGFDEPSGNFQANNQGRGGLEGDHVMALAQSGAGTNNANFLTPSDGGRGRMRMYLFTAPNPDKDGDLDNGVITHEFGHGISNRLTGGPAASGCLSNNEEGGEGWGDYNALMLTTNWATASVNDGALARPMGTYVMNQPVNGSGIRNYPYSTNMAINPLTYANMGVAPIGTEVHNIGEIWCMALWEMTWEIIKQTNTINPDLLNPAGTGGIGGNSIAMKLVVEGMRLQPCSPGFIDARNAILKADTLFFGAQYSCSIWKAFAKRGMGRFASQGSSNSATDQVASFVGLGPIVKLTQAGITAVPEGQNIVYTNHVEAGPCEAVANYLLTDTLPVNVTFVSATNGGTYNSGNRVVSWPVNLAASASADYGFTVNINAGSYYPPISIINEPVTTTTIPASWTTASTTANVWIAHNLRSHSAPNSFFTPDAAVVSDQTIATTSAFALGATTPTLSFWHWYNTESSYDGCVVEISTNGGTSWSDIGAANIIQNGYTGSISTSFSNPLGGRLAWTGNSNQFVETKINMAPYANQANVKLRWRLGSDNGVSATGWNVDDITLEDIAHVDMRTSLFDNLAARIFIADTTTIISSPASCTAPTVNVPTLTQPACPTPATGTIVVNATGSGTLEYSIDGGSNYQASNTFSGLAPGNYNISVRLQASPSCVTLYSGNPVVINIPTGLPVITAPTVTQPSCPTPVTGTIVVNATGSGTLEYSIDGGANYQASNTFSGLTAGNYNIFVRLQGSPLCATAYSSNPIVISAAPGIPVISAPTVTQPTCFVSTGTIVVNATGSGTLEYSIDGGANYQTGNSFSGLIPGNYNIFVRVQSSPACAMAYGGNPVILLTPICGGCTLLCPANITVNNDPGVCGAIVNYPPPQTAGTCGTVTSVPASGSLFPVGTTVVTVTSSSGPVCTFSITVNDNEAPSITCPAPVTVSCAGDVPAPNVAAVTASDNCSGVTVTHISDVVSAQTCANRFIVTRTYRATDAAGNTADCSQVITVNDVTPPVLTCPAPVTVSCSGDVPAPDITAVTGVSDNCGGAVTVTYIGDVISGQTCANRYTITRTYRATDICGNFADCTQVITVDDQTAPVITCPSNITVTTPVGSCTATVSFTPTATDNCSGAVTITSVPASGSVFPIGTTTVTVTAKDVCGNTSTCNFTVTVIDAQPPTITLQPTNITTCVGSNAVFKVTAANAVGYQWQAWNGSTWNDIAGATAATYTVNSVTTSMNTNSYRVKVSGLCTSVISTHKSLYVNSLPTVSIAASQAPLLLPGQTISLKAEVSPGGGSFVWYKNGSIMTGVSGQTLSDLDVDDIGTYKVVYTDLNGCVSTSAELTISGKESNNLWVYPNPNTGQFQVRYYNQGNEPATVNVYNSIGKVVYRRSITTGATAYSSINVSLPGQAAGVYVVKVISGSGKELAVKRIVIEH